jgi:uncharacterized alkaline shock family protein YloU
MSEQSSSEKSTTGGGAAIERSQDSGGALASSHGGTTIADGVVAKVAGIATREVSGVHSLGGGASRALSRVGFGDERSQGVSVEVGEREAAVDLTVVVEYGESIPTVTNAIRENVIRRVEGICGLTITEVNITVNDLYFPGDDADQAESQPARVQ